MRYILLSGSIIMENATVTTLAYISDDFLKIEIRIVESSANLFLASSCQRDFDKVATSSGSHKLNMKI